MRNTLIDYASNRAGDTNVLTITFYLVSALANLDDGIVMEGQGRLSNLDDGIVMEGQGRFVSIIYQDYIVTEGQGTIAGLGQGDKNQPCSRDDTRKLHTYYTCICINN